jgi:hypothetical protein
MRRPGGASSERFATCGTAEIVVPAARAGRLGDDLEVAAAAAELDQRLVANSRRVEG